MGTPNAQVLGQFAVDPSVTSISDFDSGSEQYEFTNESMRMTQAHVDSMGVRGTRSRVKDRVRIGQEICGGQVSMMLTPNEFRKWLPRILGGAEGGSGPYTYAFAETLPTFGMLFERGAKRAVYTGCYVNRAVFTGTPGNLIGCNLDIFAKEEILSNTAWSGSIPAIDSGQPYVFGDVLFGLAADASADDCLGFTLAIDNFLERRFPNSITATEIFPTDRLVTLEMQVPYTSDEVDLVDQAVAGNSGTLSWTNGVYDLDWSFANLKFPNETPTTTGRNGERIAILRGSSYMSSSTRELSATLALA